MFTFACITWRRLAELILKRREDRLAETQH